MGVSVSYASKVTTTEVLEVGVPAANDKTLQHNGFDTTATANGTSTPPVTKCAFFEQALDAGAATVDLTALPGSNGATVVGTGLRVQFLKFRNKSTNGNPMTLSKGASNGYDGFGADFSVTLPPGAEVLIRPLDAGSDISGTNKNLDLAGTLAQVAQLAVILG